jgi:uncharacterized protein YjbI with pentapeptide repeats
MTIAVFAGFTLLFLSVVSIVILGYIYTWKWTGVVGKTFWDWLKLMIVPIVLGAGGYSVVRAFAWSDQMRQWQQTQEAQRQAQDALRQVSLDQISLAYTDRMETLLADRERPLRRSSAGDELQTVARPRTLNVLEALDPRRRGSIIRFLHDSQLISTPHPVIRLSGANLTRAYLRGADLNKADLQGVGLSEADLSGATLVKVDLSGANLSDAHLNYATLVEADLSGANLSGADLQGAGLERADVSRAFGITNEDLERKTFRLNGATMPDGSKHP